MRRATSIVNDVAAMKTPSAQVQVPRYSHSIVAGGLDVMS